MATHVTKKETEERKRPLAVFFHDRLPHILYHYAAGKTDRLCIAPSTDGISFTKVCIEATITAKKATSLKECRSFKLSPKQPGYFLTYTKHHGDVFKVITAESKDLKKWKIIDEDSALPQPGFIVPRYLHNNLHVFYYGDYGIKIATSKTLSGWHLEKHIVLSPRSGHFDNCALDVLAVHKEEDGIHLLYDASYTKNKTYYMQIGGAILSADDPQKVLWRSDLPLFSETFEMTTPAKKATSLGALFQTKKIMIYWLVGEKGLHTLSIPRFSMLAEKKKTKEETMTLAKHPQNPILEPRANHAWESEGAFNPTAVEAGGKIHILYRAVGSQGVSAIGHAVSTDGVTIEKRSAEPIYIAREAFEGAITPLPKEARYSPSLYMSGGGWGGCEDPKTTSLEDRIYLTYVAVNGWAPQRVAISSISKEDFLNEDWKKWKKPVLMSPPNVIDKSAVLLPEKINGKFVIFHRIYPNILIDFVDDLEFGEGRWLKGEYKISPRPSKWDNHKLSVGAPPIKTKDGWLVIYHAIDKRDFGRYKIGAMLLELQDPTKVIARTSAPILEPIETYENEGKAGVAYPGGAIVKDGILYVYYGGGDRVTAVATAPLDEFLMKLKKDLDIKLVAHKVQY